MTSKVRQSERLLTGGKATGSPEQQQQQNGERTDEEVEAVRKAVSTRRLFPCPSALLLKFCDSEEGGRRGSSPSVPLTTSFMRTSLAFLPIVGVRPL